MTRYTIVIRYDDLEAYQLHGAQMEKMTKDRFAERGATEQTLFISTRSLPPIHTTSFVAPASVSIEDLKQVQFPKGVQFDLHEEA
ncbi:hypothetical protein BDV59DRAFT_204554 [Aspergillus ambiguus]|uniref:uncharacterized protein n=1 Tax=Aspergillus ambiguus TaxID=176160 RepID=UPI003CCDE91C